MSDWFDNAGTWWLALAAVLAIAELMLPGVFLIFVAIGAGITGAIALLFPDLPLAGQLVSVALWSSLAVLIGKRWYFDHPVESSDPQLNDRVARLLGETVVVTRAIEGGSGRVRVGDGEWTAYGDDAPVGTRVRVTGGDRGALKVAPLETLLPPP